MVLQSPRAILVCPTQVMFVRPKPERMAWDAQTGPNFGNIRKIERFCVVVSISVIGGAARQQHEWVKVHLMCGVRSNIVTAVEIRDKDASDTKLLPDLLGTAAKNFTISEISADKGYGSVKNYKAIQRRGGVPYIAFKSIHTGRAEGLWKKMFHYFQFRRDEFLAHYHKRSNVESTFSMIKAKFGDHLRSKTDVAMINEALCKIICHNICCLIQEAQELGITTEFWANQSTPR